MVFKNFLETNVLKLYRELRANHVNLDLPDWERITAHPDWSRRLEAATRATNDAKSVVISPVPSSPRWNSIFDYLLALSLTLRGARVKILLCDRVLPACESAVIHHLDSLQPFLDQGPAYKYCAYCLKPQNRMFASSGFEVLRYSNFIDAAGIAEVDEIAASLSAAEIPAHEEDGLRVGEHSLAGTLRFFASSDLDDPRAEAVLRRYFRAGLITARVIRRLIETTPVDVFCFHHGIYVPQGIVGEVARKYEKRVVNYNVGYRKHRMVLSHGDSYHHTMMTEPTDEWSGTELTADQDRALMDYLHSRRYGTNDWIRFHDDKKVGEFDEIAASLGLDRSKPLIGMLTNVAWDAQLHYPANAFSNMFHWIFETVEYFAGRPELQLVIRVHPGENRGIVSRQKVADVLYERFGRLPANVFLVGPESPISTYGLMENCDSVIIYGTKMGVELSTLGIPIIVAGEAWIRNKGITRDITDREEYKRVLDGLPGNKRLPEDIISRAKKYAHHFFFRRMVPVGALKPTGSFPHFKLSIGGLEELEAGRDPGLDVICNGILEGTPFAYDE